MTQHNSRTDKRLVGSLLPWLIATFGLLLYLLTLNGWISIPTFVQVAQRSGWALRPELSSPLYSLLTYPIGWLSPGVRPIAFNLFSVLCGVLTLALLARAVALMPQDRTVDQRQRERNKAGLSRKVAWIPPVLAAVVLGLQLTFWESATAGSSEMLNVLILAYAIRNILEYRVTKNENWLLKSSLAWGAGLANSWLLFCLFPWFLVALIWIRRLSFFNAQFLFRMFLCGVAGLLLYLFLPLVHVASSSPVYTFWQALKVNLAGDKNAFLYFYLRAPLNVRLSLAITSLLPILLISIRWSTNFGDTSRLGGLLAKWVLHVAHAALFVACVWVAFNPGFSPRRLGYPFPELAFLSALSAGYIAGYFLVVFNPLPDRMGRTSSSQRLALLISRSAVWGLLVLVPLGLVARNLPQIRMTNSTALKDHAFRLVEGFPAKAAILSDDPQELLVAQAALAQQGRLQNYVFLDTTMLPAPLYHQFQKMRYGETWPDFVNPSRTNKVEDMEILYVVSKLADTMPLRYLNPSFGYYFEFFDARPRGLSYELVLHSTNSLAGPPLSDEELRQNQRFWSDAAPSLEKLAAFTKRPGRPVRFLDVLWENLRLPPEINATAQWLGSTYSRSLDGWGVAVQRAGILPEAGRCFELAAELNPDNIAAKGNLKFNRELVAEKKPVLDLSLISQAQLGPYQDWQQAMQRCGPFDDPARCFALGMAFLRGKNFRQGGIELQRVHELVPGDLRTRLALAGIYTRFRFTEKALEITADLSTQREALEKAGIPVPEAVQAEAVALYSANRGEKADALLNGLFKEKPQDPAAMATVIQVSSMFGRLTNALPALDQLQKLRPDDPAVLVSKGFTQIQLNAFSNAIPTLNRALELQETNRTALLYRALAYLGSEQMDLAEKDYQELYSQFPNALEVNSGLARIALKRSDTNAALAYYYTCLSNSAPASPQHRFFLERVKELSPTQ